MLPWEMSTKGFKVDANDPRAPPADVWEAMTEAERAKVIASLPSEIPRAHPPEGDRHFLPKIKAREALGEYFVTSFITYKRNELERFSRFVTDWEFLEYAYHL